MKMGLTICAEFAGRGTECLSPHAAWRAGRVSKPGAEARQHLGSESVSQNLFWR